MTGKPDEKDSKKPPQTARSKAFERFERKIIKTVFNSIKMATAVLTDPLSHPLAVYAEIKHIGHEAFLWKPETLMAEIDRRISNWSSEQIAEALEHFHNTGELKTNVPSLVRQKIYALRVISTSDTPHSEWHIFEKIGCAFNDRLANFGIVEPLSPAECARTVALIEAIRPDEYNNEIRAYIAACCHQDGIYTVQPSKYLGIAEDHLAMMNKEATGRATSPEIVEKIKMKLETIHAEASKIREVEDNFIDIQATKLFAIDSTGDDSLNV